jgi:ATP-dependent DNA helicase RecQ
VRVIVHFQAPGSLEAYYQEAGRAGRDGAPAQCLLLFGAGDLMTQRRIAQGGAGAKRLALLEESLRAVAGYATAWTCRQQMLCAHFTGTDDHVTCGACDVCRDPAGNDGVRRSTRASAGHQTPAASALGDAEQQIIIAALTAHGRAVGKGNLVKALRGSEAKTVVVHGLERLAQHGALAAFSEVDIAATIEQLLRDRRLVRRGRKYPTVALPGPAKARTPRGAFGKRGRDGSAASSITVELDRYRKRMARQLKWKAYMVFQRGVISALDRERPDSLAALARIPGLGPNRIARFGEDLLAIVRRYGASRVEPAQVAPAVLDLFSQLARD